MIHLGGAFGLSSMFEMARRAGLNVRVKRGRLPLEQRSIVRVTDDAFASFDSGDGRVTRGAIVLQRCVRLRKITGIDHVLPEHGRENRPRCFLAMPRRQHEESEDEQRESDDGKQKRFLQRHANHLNPKLSAAQTCSARRA